MAQVPGGNWRAEEMADIKKSKTPEQAAAKAKSLETLIDAQLDSIVVGGWSRSTFSRVKPD
jgi:hypothetical protein